jgi:poly-gamma-glutamate capsule biosynthesis protein CapA/YwtB (metallophosphatase superfamily)
LISVFLCGDVMTGRGIDQILPHPSRPNVYEPAVNDAREYIKLAEEKNGSVPKPADYSYIWGTALRHLEQQAPDFRVINLETSITTSEDYLKDKQINYRMHPKNTPCLTAAKIDCCSLANNHVLDWGISGLTETLQTLKAAGIKVCGAGETLAEAESPAVLEAKGGRLLFFAFGSESSGVPPDWAATEDKPGIAVLDENQPDAEAKRIRRLVEPIKRQGDVAAVSIHWGRNWGYEVPFEQRLLAHRLISEAGVDLIHGHSSHHPKGVEVYHDKLILYGCGDFLNDYEGIWGYEAFRGDLGLMYFASLNPEDGSFLMLRMVPTQIRKLRVNDASEADAQWLWRLLDQECGKLGSRVDFKERYLWLKRQ